MKMKLKIAGHVFEIEHVLQYMHEYCKDYFTEEEAEYHLRVTKEDWEALKKRSVKADDENFVFSQLHLEMLSIYVKIVRELLEHDILLFHGSAVAVDGQAYLFTAKSGTGKSTHARLWRDYFGDRAIMVNDDKPLIRLTEHGASVIGSPWNGKHRLSNDIEVPLKAICILEQCEQNHIQPISGRDAWPMLFQQAHRPPEEDKMAKTLQLVDRLSKSVKLYRLGCNMDPEAAKISYEGMQ